MTLLIAACPRWACADDAALLSQADSPSLSFAADDAAPSTPSITGYEAAAGVLDGTGRPGSVVRAVGPSGETLSEALVAADGSFELVLPEAAGLSGASLVAIDPETGSTSAALGAEELVAALEAAQEGQVRSAVAASTADLASDVASSLAASGIGDTGTAASDTGMPVAPYILGAASAMLAMGAVGAAVCAGARVRRRKADEPAEFPAGLSEPGTAGSLTPAPLQLDGPVDDLAPRPFGAHFAQGGSKASADDDGDAVVRAALAFVGEGGDDGELFYRESERQDARPFDSADGLLAPTPERPGSTGGPDDTLPCLGELPPSDPDRFAEVARLLATGTGTVHRVVAPTLDVDMSGLERMDGQEAAPSWARESLPDPFSDGEDWREVALRELGRADRDEAPVPQRTLPTVDRPEPTAYVAPVVGPASLTRQDAERHQSLLARARSPQASALRRRDEVFKAQRARMSREEREQEGVPQIARGAGAPLGVDGSLDGIGAGLVAEAGGALAGRGRSVAVPEVDERPQAAWSADFASGSAVAPGFARREGGSRSLAPEGLRAAPQVREDPAVVTSAVAAAYAAAVYSDVATRVPANAGTGSLRLAVPQVTGEDDGRASSGARWAAAEEEATRPFSPAYIDYLVQEEFEHRHDTIAQRNAALGRLHVVNGAAQAPVSVRDGLALHRYMA